MIIKIKPMSVNSAWCGKRFKTPEYKDYELEMHYILPKKIELFDKMKLIIKFGFSRINCDIDNPVKPFLDILQKKYGFNDSKIWKLEIEKNKVNKGKEYIEFEFQKYDT